MVQKDIFQNISFVKIIRVVFIISLLFPNLVKADTIDNYKELEYIESTGTQCIDTGYKPKLNTIYMEYKFKDATTGEVMGTYASGWTTGIGHYHNASSSENEWLHYYSNNRSSATGGSGEYVVEWYKGVAKINGINAMNKADRNTTINFNLFIFAGNWAGSKAEQPISMKLYYFKIKEGPNENELTTIRDYMPVKRKSDDKVGLYDKENNVFYTNCSYGSGEFLGGPEIGNEEPPIPPTPSNSVIPDFITIYTDRLSYLANGTIENNYMMAFIGIIFGFIVLEMTLHIIHIRGGYKK